MALPRAVLPASLAALTICGLTMPAAAIPGPEADPLSLPCAEQRGEVSPEEEILDQDNPRRILSASGLDADAADFAASLCEIDDDDDAEELIRSASASLWTRGLEAGRIGVAEGVADIDDRPLYWARLAHTAAVRQWADLRELPQERGEELIRIVDELSRGQDLLHRPEESGDYVIVTGFDPFFLTREDRTANPSGAIAMALDGTTIAGPDGPVTVRAALFPVRWRDFGEGMVERALTPALESERAPLALFTVSQGSPGTFSLEAHNGAWRAGTVDNEQVCHQGVIPNASLTGDAQPQWTVSTLPRREIVDEVGQEPFALEDRTLVTEVPGDTPAVPTRIACPADAAANAGTQRADGPSAGSQARAGGGGNYLSNEIAYRATLLRDSLGLDDLPAGHVHTPVLTGVNADPEALSNPEFETQRQNQIAQAREIFTAALRHLPDAAETPETPETPEGPDESSPTGPPAEGTTAPTASTAPAVEPGESASPLPRTGGTAWLPGLVGAGLLLAGGTALALARRRH